MTHIFRLQLSFNYLWKGAVRRAEVNSSLFYSNFRAFFRIFQTDVTHEPEVPRQWKLHIWKALDTYLNDEPVTVLVRAKLTSPWWGKNCPFSEKFKKSKSSPPVVKYIPNMSISHVLVMVVWWVLLDRRCRWGIPGEIQKIRYFFQTQHSTTIYQLRGNFEICNKKLMPSSPHLYTSNAVLIFNSGARVVEK